MRVRDYCSCSLVSVDSRVTTFRYFIGLQNKACVTPSSWFRVHFSFHCFELCWSSSSAHLACSAHLALLIYLVRGRLYFRFNGLPQPGRVLPSHKFPPRTLLPQPRALFTIYNFFISNSVFPPTSIYFI